MRVFRVAPLLAIALLATQVQAFDFTHMAFNAIVHQSHDLQRLSSDSKHKHSGNSEQEYKSGTISETDALALYSPQQRKLTFDSCVDQFPGGRPLAPSMFPASMKPMELCSNHFAVLYSQTSKTPLVVVERLNTNRLASAKGEERTNQFYPDPRIPAASRAELSDYRGQHPAVDRGHNAPAADAPDHKAMAQSFALSNMMPQDPVNNRKMWSKVESDVRKFAMRAPGNVYVFTGPIFDAGHDTIGSHHVWKPTRLYKLVYDESSKRAWAYVMDNAEVRIERPIDYPAFVATTGLHLLDGQLITGSIGGQR